MLRLQKVYFEEIKICHTHSFHTQCITSMDYCQIVKKKCEEIKQNISYSILMDV